MSYFTTNENFAPGLARTPALCWGQVYRNASHRIGKAKAVTATARKIAVLFCNAVRHGMDYSDPGTSYYEERYRARVLANLRRRAKNLGFVLQEASSPV